MNYAIFEARTGFYVGSRFLNVLEKWAIENAGFICKKTGKEGE